jgi:menaquinone-9 beta-reductase
MRRTDPLIIGGGPAGTAAAITLATAGARPLILERQAETGDAICGGFLSWRTCATLHRLGIDESTLRGHQVTRVMISSGAKSAEAPLPGGAVGVSRRHLDSVLLAKAQEKGVAVERGVTVREIMSGHQLRLADGSLIEGESVFLATGKHDLRGAARAKGTTIGLRVRIAAHPTLGRLIDNKIELHLFEGGYAGLMLQEDGSANLCVAVSKDRLTAAGSDPAKLLQAIGQENALLGERLAHWQSSDVVDAIAAVPYGWRGSETKPGFFRLGDQAAVIPSLAGEGNGIALASGIAAAKSWLAGGAQAAPRFQRGFAQRTRRPVMAAALLWRAGERPALARMATSFLPALPGLAGLLARVTRIPH